MIAAISQVRSLLLAIFMLMAGSGFMATLLSLRLERAGQSTIVIGAVATIYFAGLIVGALRSGHIVRRVGHIRAFAAFVALLSASTLGYAQFAHPLLWSGLRLIDGFCVAGVFVCLESWLNERADVTSRGSILATYMVALYCGQAVGQLLLGASGDLPAAPFQLASMLISLAIIPLCLTRGTAPAPTEAPAFGIRTLLHASPLGTVGAVTTGLMLGAFYGLAAVQVRRLGLDLSQTANFMMIVILGGVVLQWPLGRLSDRYDRRQIIVLCFTATLCVSLGISMLSSIGPWLLILGGDVRWPQLCALSPMRRTLQRSPACGAAYRRERTAGVAIFHWSRAWADRWSYPDDRLEQRRTFSFHRPLRRRHRGFRNLATDGDRSRPHARTAGISDCSAHHSDGVLA